MERAAANRRIQEAFDQLERDIADGRAAAEDLGLRILRDGRWAYRGSLIKRPGIVKLFASVLKRTSDGRYWLVTPVERTVVHVDDVPFVGVELRAVAGAEPALAVRTNLDAWIDIGPNNPLRMREQADGSLAPYVDCGGGLEARLGRTPYYELADLAEDDGSGRLIVRSHGTSFVLGVGDEGAAG